MKIAYFTAFGVFRITPSMSIYVLYLPRYDWLFASWQFAVLEFTPSEAALERNLVVVLLWYSYISSNIG